jgi:hypothetical protein
MPPQPLRERMPAIPPEVEQVVLRALAKDSKARFVSVRDFAAVLEQASQHASSPTAHISSEQPVPGSPIPTNFATIVVPFEAPPAPVASSVSPETPPDPATPPGLAGGAALTATTPAPTGVPLLPGSARPQQRRIIAGLPAALLIGLVVVVIAAGVLGSLSLLAHFGVIGTYSGPPAPIAVQGGTWTVDTVFDPDSLIPNGAMLTVVVVRQWEVLGDPRLSITREPDSFGISLPYSVK